MRVKDEHEPGRCTLCFEDTDVRWKNLYTIGSEGTTMCLPCEKKILRFCEGLMREAAMARKEKFKRRKKLNEENKSKGLLRTENQTEGCT